MDNTLRALIAAHKQVTQAYCDFKAVKVPRRGACGDEVELAHTRARNSLQATLATLEESMAMVEDQMETSRLEGAQ